MKTEITFPDQNRYIRYLLGCYIRRKRSEFGYSIPEIASQVELSTQNFKRIEAGRMKISPEVFEKMQTLLSFDAEDLANIRKIACVKYINDISKALVPHFPA